MPLRQCKRGLGLRVWVDVDDVERVSGSCSMACPPRRALRVIAGCEARGSSPRAPAPSGCHRRGEDRTGELLEPLLMLREAELRHGWWLLSLDPRKRRTTGMKKGMEESYIEDLANRDGPVHALVSREGAAKRCFWGACRPAIEPRNRQYWGGGGFSVQ